MKHPGDAYFAQVGDVLRESYLRYSFTKGTEQEVAFLVELLGLEPGARILDVGCGPGRHSIALAQAGYAVTGIDVSRGLLDVAAERANEVGAKVSLFHVDARQMPFESEFDAVISICQGAFGLMGRDDPLILRRMFESAKPKRGRVVLTAFSSLYEAANPREGATMDVDAGIVHERTSIRDPEGVDHDTDLWTGVYTPRELRLLAIGVGLVPEHVWSVEPGDFARRTPDLDHPEFMLVARRP